MKTAVIILALCLGSLHIWASASLAGRAYYIAPTGNDGNTGTLAAPWLTPLHSVNCNDILYAAAGTYTAANFQSGKWGTVSCATGQMARLVCSVFDTCKITGGNGILVDKSYWSVQGWEVQNSNAGCFNVSPSGAANIHHISFVNDIANGCQLGGFGAYPTGLFGVDYWAVVGSISYDAARGSLHCYSGISAYELVRSDTTAGTHVYVGGNFSYKNQNPATCNGTAGTDGDCVIIDTLDGSQTVGLSPYDQQVYVVNNLCVVNGGWGLEVQNNAAGAAHAPVFLKYNTMWGNRVSPTGFNTTLCVDTAVNVGFSVQFTWNIVETTIPTSCPVTNPLWGMFVYNGDGTVIIDNNWVFTVSGNNIGSFGSPGFSPGPNNQVGNSPFFASPGLPSAPVCSAASSVANCMSGVLLNFRPSALGATSYGVQPVLLTNSTDALYPHWLCGSVPAGLVTRSC